MLHQDRLTLAVLLARIYLRGLNEPPYNLEFEHLLHAQQAAAAHRPSILPSAAAQVPGRLDRLSEEQQATLTRLTRLPAFKNAITIISSDDVSFLLSITSFLVF